MKIRIAPIPFSRDLRDHDLVRRGAAMAQEQQDIQTDAEWRRRVRANPKERARLHRWAAMGIA